MINFSHRLIPSEAVIPSFVSKVKRHFGLIGVRMGEDNGARTSGIPVLVHVGLYCICTTNSLRGSCSDKRFGGPDKPFKANPVGRVVSY